MPISLKSPTAKVGIQFDTDKIDPVAMYSHLSLLWKEWTTRGITQGIGTVTHWFIVPYSRVVEFENVAHLPVPGCLIVRESHAEHVMAVTEEALEPTAPGGLIPAEGGHGFPAQCNAPSRE